MSATINLRLNDDLNEFVQRNVGEGGSFDTVSEFIHHALRNERERQENRDFEIVKRHLQEAFAAPREEAVPFDANAIRAELFHKPNA